MARRGSARPYSPGRVVLGKLNPGYTEMSRLSVLTLALSIAASVGLISKPLGAAPSVYPTGTTIYDPSRAWSGYVVFHTPGPGGAVLIDMNGTEVRRWPDLRASPGPFRVLPGGYVISGTVPRPPHQETVALVQQDWEGNEVWRFDRAEQVETEDGEMVWSSRQHHDWQREGSAVGYFAPESEPSVDGGRTLILAHKNVMAPAVTDKRLEDDYIYEVSWDGEVLWEWLASDHVEEFGFSEAARNALYRNAAWNEERQSSDWFHINSASYLGENRWYDDGDERFHPDNVIISSRNANIVAIIGRTGEIVWRIGPDYRESAAMLELGQISGQHHPHIIPKGLPGAGNLMIFDNGGRAGYGAPNPSAPGGTNAVTRYHSRVVELNPLTLENLWEYSIPGGRNFQFFSYNVSMAQRLPNGNTFITEGAAGRLFEVTPENEIVWEYMSPYFNPNGNGRNNIYRAYRVPYEWVPQLDRPEERQVVPPELSEFRIEPQ